MTRKINLLALMLIFALSSSFAQVADEVTKNPEQNASWRMGKSNYSAKPKNAWELGIHAGHYLIDGDVDRLLPAGYGLGLHLRKAIHYAFSIRADLFYGQAKGLETQTWTHSSVRQGDEIGGGLVEPQYSPYNINNGHPDGRWFPSHKTRQVYGAFQGIINIGNLLFHKDRNKWNWYIGVGAGLNSYKTQLDLLDANGNAYSDLLNQTDWTFDKFNSKSGRDDIKDALQGIYDGEYETEGPKKAGIFRLGDETNIHFMFTGSVGVSRKISNRINIGLEHQVMASDNDYLDGIRFRSSDDLTADVDLEHYTNVRLAINLGNMDEVTEPLYWLNPLDNTMNDIAALKQRPVLDLTDSDGDGVIDMMDQEIDSPSGAIVDTRGVTLDSDSDGIADYKDKEPYSLPGKEIDANGVAMVDKYLTENEVNSLVDTKTSVIMKEVSGMKSDCGKWFLPMIHFDNDKYTIKPEFYGQLHHVANVMKQCPSTCVAVVGHTDARNSDDYNNVLSYNRAEAALNYISTNYGIDRSRFKLMYGGESTPLINGAKSSSENYFNRRVEFRVCEAGDNDMGRPSGPNAGSGSVRGTGSGSTFSGNKNSGY